MNEQATLDAYNLFVQTGYSGTANEFARLIIDNPNALNDSYNLFIDNGYNGTYDDYKNLLGVTKVQNEENPSPSLKKKGQGTMARMVTKNTTESFLEESLSASQPKTQVAPKAQVAPKQKPGILAQPVPKTTTESFLATASAEPSIQPIGAKPKVAEKPKEEQKTGYLKTLYDNLALGASYANEAIFSLPETVINVLSIPQNYIAEKTGWNIGSNADILKEQLGIKNPILDWVQENQKVLNGEVAKNISDRYTDGGIVSNFSSGNYKDGFELLGASIAQSVPISIGFMLGGAYTAPAKLAAVSTLALTENQRQELEEMDPNMSESEKTMKALAMSGAESLFSSLGTGTIGKVYRDIAKKEGTEAAKGILKDGLVQTYKRALEKGGAVTGFVGEGIEEAATTITQNVISGKPAFEGAADAFVTGAGSGVVFTAPISAINAKKYIQNKIEVYDTKDKIGQILKDKADNIDKLYNVPVASEITAQQLEVANLPKSRDILVTNLKKSVAKGDITEDDAKQSLFVFDKIQQVSGSLSDLDVSVEDKAKIASLLKQRDELKIKTQNKDDVLVVAEKQQIEEINNQIQLIITKSKEDAIQEQTAGQVPVQSETGTSVQVAEGEPQAEPQGVTQEGQEITQSLRDVESTAKALESLPVEERNIPLSPLDLDNEGIITWDESNPQSVAEAYHRAKKEGGNTELVQAVENLLAPQVAPQENQEVKAEEVTEEKSQQIGTQIGDLVETFNTALQGGLDIGGTPNEKRARTRNSKKAYKKLKDFFGFEFGARENAEQASKQDALSDLANMINTEYGDVNEMMKAYKEDKANGVATPVVQSIDTLLGITPAAAPQVAPQENQAQVETLRAQEQTELMEAIPNATQYVVDGKVDRTKISDPNDLKTFDAIYDKYDKLITPLLQTTEVSSETQITPTQQDEQAPSTPPTTGPVAGNRLFNNPLTAVSDIAKRYYKRVFKKDKPDYYGSRQFDEARAKRISDAFIAMQHEPNNPQVKKAYEALAKETLEQYKAFLEAGYRVEINNEEPYANSQEMIDDLRNRKRIKIFSTESGFGDNPITPKQRKENPLLKESGFKDVNGQPLLINDAFRAIHDFFGHAELGNSFGFKGEENAWNVHARMFSPLARRAMTTETRGQNSYVNFSGVNQEIDAMREQARKLRAEGKEAEAQAIAEQIYELGSFADQKIGLLPEEFSEIDVNDIGDVNLQPQGLQLRDVEAAPATEQAPVEEVTVEEEEQYEPITIKDIDHDTFTRDNASDYEEDEREGDNGRSYTYLSSVTVPIMNQDGDTIGYLVKMSDGDGELTFDAEDENGSRISKNDEGYLTLGDAKKAFVEAYNKTKKKEFDKEAKAKAKQKAKQAEKAATKAAKAAAKEGAAKVEEVQETIDELLALDPNDKSTAQKWSDGLAKKIKDIERFEKTSLGVNVALPIVKGILQAVKALIDAGISLQQALKQVAKDNNITEQQVKDNINIAPILGGFGEVMTKVDALIARQKAKGITDAKIVSNVDTFIRNTEVYQAANDAQKKILEKEGRAKMGADERRAPSIGRVLGVLKDFTNISRQEKIQIIKQIRGLSQDSAKSLAKEIKEMANVGKITLNQAANIIAKFGKVNLLNERSVGSFVDYMSKVFSDAEYTAKLSEANRTKKDISKLAKNKDKNANLRDMAQQFVKINPSMVEDIDAYNAMAASVKEAIKGSTIRGQNVNFASTVNIENASEYISKTLAVQNEAIRQQKAEEIQELMGIDASKLSYEEMMSLLDSTEPITKYNEGIIRSTINKMFDTYSSIIKETLSTGKDQFTDEDVEFTKNQKDLVRRFMEMDLNLLKPKEALQAVDALNNFLNNKSTAKMEAVLSDYTGRKNATIVKGKKIVAQPLMKYYSKALGRFLGEQTTNLNVLFERMFKGVTRGGFVEDMSGVTMLKNKKSFAERQANNIVNDYVNEFYKTKANGEAFNTDYNNTERGIASFMMRNVIGTQAEMQTEFNRRKGLIEQSIDELSQGNELEQKKAELYKKAYDKVVKDSKNISDIKKKVDPKNLEAIDWWQNQWSDKYEQLSDVSENIYNKVLDKDLNYTPDKFANLSFETGTVELSTEESAFHRNNGTIYKKETGVLMAATKPSNLPSNKNGDTSMYIDLSFDKNNSNSMYDALVDINTAAPIRQVESFLNSSDFKSIVPQAEDAKILKDRINLYVRNIRNKNPYTNDELSAAVRKLNKIAAIGVGQALGGVLQPVKQIVPVAMNTLINGGGLDISAPFNAAKTKFLNNSGYAIANRGIESQAQIESINKLIDLAAKSTGAKALGYLEQANKFWLKQLLVRPDVYVARASWMTYYEQSLKKQGIDPNGIDYNTHELNEQAGNYAQRMVDRQQNVSDADLSGKLFVNKESSNQLMVKMLMAFASFRMNQSARLGSDLAVMLDDTSTEEDRTIAARSLTGYAAEAVMFRAISAASIIAIGSIAKYALGMDEDDDEFKKRVNDVVKGQITGITTDLFSPLPIVDKGVQFGVNTALEQIQNALSISKEKQLNIYGVGKQSALQNLGMFGISAERALQLVELVKLSTTGTYTDDFGNTKTISEEGQKALRLMIAPALLTNVGALPTEINSVIRNAVKFSKKKYKSAEDKAEAEERAVEKEETVEQKISTLESLRNFTDNPEEINAINKEIYELSADDETKAIIKEERKKERRVKESLLTNPETGEEYDNESDMKKYNPRLYNENFGPESQWYQDHKWEREIEKKMNKEITKAEEQEQGYVAPSRKRSGSSGFGPQKRSSSSGFGPQNKKGKSGFGPQD
jgi:hypothetical protein